MVSNALSRRRHTLLPPAVCYSPPFVPPPYAPPGACTCLATLSWTPPYLEVQLSINANLTTLPPGSPITITAFSTPALNWPYPMTASNAEPGVAGTSPVPPGTDELHVYVRFTFSNGYVCSARCSAYHP